MRWSEPREFRDFAIPRKPQGHKGDYGHALIVAGSVGKSGAAVLASWAALRAGAGLVTAATPEPVSPIVAAHTPEVMTEPLRATETGSIALANIEHGYFDALLKGKKVLAMGPGLFDASRDAGICAQGGATGDSVPIVLDADGLNAFAGRAVGAERFADTCWRDAASGRNGAAAGQHHRRCAGAANGSGEKGAADWNCYVILKGHQTITAAPDGNTWVNSTGNPGMATGGTGDALTGMLAGLTAQYGTETWENLLSFRSLPPRPCRRSRLCGFERSAADGGRFDSVHSARVQAFLFRAGPWPKQRNRHAFLGRDDSARPGNRRQA